MRFGIRISSPFHLNTLNIPILNIKCPKNTKNACADIIFSPAIICEAWIVSSLHKHAKPNLSMNHIVRCNALCWDMWSKMKVITEFCYFFFKEWNGVPCVSPIVSPSFQSSKHTWQHCYVRACVFGVFRHLIFWIGMFKVFRWFGLEILIPKHMWKSIIGPLEQI